MEQEFGCVDGVRDDEPKKNYINPEIALADHKACSYFYFSLYIRSGFR